MRDSRELDTQEHCRVGRPLNDGICPLCSGMLFLPQGLCSILEMWGKHLAVEVCCAVLGGDATVLQVWTHRAGMG